jgi:AcrR family transcriptional regulator
MAAPEARVDGRHERRLRGRQAVVDAMIDLLEEGHLPPAVDDVAQRAGVSTATLYRYFPTLDDLRAETIARFAERRDDLYALPAIGAGTLDERVAGLVRARLALYEALAPVARWVRSRSHEQPQLAETLGLRRAMLARQVEDHFAPELALRTTAERADLVRTVVTLTSFEAWDLWAAMDSPDADIARAWRTALTALLTPG